MPTVEGPPLYNALDDHRDHKVVIDKTSRLLTPGDGIMVYCEACEESVVWLSHQDGHTDPCYHFAVDPDTHELVKISPFVYEPGTTADSLPSHTLGGSASAAPAPPAASGATILPGTPSIAVGDEVVILSPHVRPKYLNGVYGTVKTLPKRPSGVYMIDVDPDLLKADPRIASKCYGGTTIQARGTALKRILPL